MTRRAPDSMVSNNSLVSTIIICGANIPMDKLWKQFTIVMITPTGRGEPFRQSYK